MFLKGTEKSQKAKLVRIFLLRRLMTVALVISCVKFDLITIIVIIIMIIVNSTNQIVIFIDIHDREDLSNFPFVINFIVGIFLLWALFEKNGRLHESHFYRKIVIKQKVI